MIYLPLNQDHQHFQIEINISCTVLIPYYVIVKNIKSLLSKAICEQVLFIVRYFW